MMTDAEMQTLAAALRAENNAGVVAAMAVRNDTYLTQWCNTAGSTYCWNNAMVARDMFEDSDVTKFDNLTAGKRDAWRMMLDFAPIDFSRTKNRKAVQDVWGSSDSVAVLEACRRKATNGEMYMGSSDATTNTVTAKKLTRPGYISLDDVSNSLNLY